LLRENSYRPAQRHPAQENYLEKNIAHKDESHLEKLEAGQTCSIHSQPGKMEERSKPCEIVQL
jgi:hypothetical protein